MWNMPIFELNPFYASLSYRSMPINVLRKSKNPQAHSQSLNIAKLNLSAFRAKNECAFNRVIPENLFFSCPSMGNFWPYIFNEQIWLWILWFASQMWVTRHIWYPKSPRLASTERMFNTPYYNGFFIEQSITMNRRRDGDDDIKKRTHHDHDDDHHGKITGLKSRDKVTRIYGCATMWHETKTEMMEMLKSVFRVDQDYSERRMMKYLGVKDPDYYEWETHIFFDDAMSQLNDQVKPPQKMCNDFVRDLVDIMDEAASFVHCRNVRVSKVHNDR